MSATTSNGGPAPLLPDAMRLARRYRAKTDIPVVAMTSWAGPGSGAYERVLGAGEDFSIETHPTPGAKAVYCRPVDYARLQRELIPLRDRILFWSYRGYYLCIDTRVIAESCEPLAEGAPSP